MVPPIATETTTLTDNAKTVTVKAKSEADISSRPGFRYGAVPVKAAQTEPLRQVRIPIFDDLQDERAFRKLHHAAALRWLGANGYNNEGAGGHVTVRDPILTDHFWINPHARSFSRMTPEDLCLVNEQGIVVGGNMHVVSPAGYAIHAAVHQARPDVLAAVHCHSIPSKAFASFGKHLDMISQDACRFYNCHSVYEGFGGSALDPQEGINIAQALGQGKAVILQNHGLLAVGKTVDAATFNFGALDRCIEAQLLADAAGQGRGWKPITVGHKEAEYTRNVYNDELEFVTFQPAFEEIVAASNGELSLTVGNEKYPDVSLSAFGKSSSTIGALT